MAELIPDKVRLPHQDLGRVTLTVVVIAGLLIVSVWVLLPFLPAILWATTLVLATWPLMLRVQRHVGNRRGIAVLVMTVAILSIVIVPLWLAVSTIVGNLDVVDDLVRPFCRCASRHRPTGWQRFLSSERAPQVPGRN